MMITDKHLADVMARIEERLVKAKTAKEQHRSHANDPEIPSYIRQGRLIGGRWHTQQMWCCTREQTALEWVKVLLEEPERAAKTPQMLQKETQEKADRLADSLRGVFPGSTVKGYSSIVDVLEERGKT